MSTGKVVLGLLAGVAAGALLGILFAPDKGTTTRKKILRKGEDFGDSLKDKFDDFLEGITEKMDEVKEEVADFTKKRKVSPEEPEKTAQ